MSNHRDDFWRDVTVAAIRSAIVMLVVYIVFIRPIQNRLDEIEEKIAEVGR